MTFVGALLEKLSTAKIGDLNAIIKMIKDFGNSLDPAVKFLFVIFRLENVWKEIKNYSH